MTHLVCTVVKAVVCNGFCNPNRQKTSQLKRLGVQWTTIEWCDKCERKIRHHQSNQRIMLVLGENCEHATRKKCKLCVNFLIFIQSWAHAMKPIICGNSCVQVSIPPPPQCVCVFFAQLLLENRIKWTKQPTSSFKAKHTAVVVPTYSLNPPLRIFLVCCQRRYRCPLPLPSP